MGTEIIPVFLPVMLLGILLTSLTVTSTLRPAEARLPHGERDLDGRAGPARPDGGASKEVLPLVRAVNTAFDRIEAAIGQQRRFSANTAHQLRTPLAILRTRIETLPPSSYRTELRARDVDRMARLRQPAARIGAARGAPGRGLPGGGPDRAGPDDPRRRRAAGPCARAGPGARGDRSRHGRGLGVGVGGGHPQPGRQCAALYAGRNRVAVSMRARSRSSPCAIVAPAFPEFRSRVLSTPLGGARRIITAARVSDWRSFATPSICMEEGSPSRTRRAVAPCSGSFCLRVGVPAKGSRYRRPARAIPPTAHRSRKPPERRDCNSREAYPVRAAV